LRQRRPAAAAHGQAANLPGRLLELGHADRGSKSSSSKPGPSTQLRALQNNAAAILKYNLQTPLRQHSGIDHWMVMAIEAGVGATAMRSTLTTRWPLDWQGEPFVVPGATAVLPVIVVLLG
jgi:hypothetical protein